MLPVPIQVQANVPIHLKATITGYHCYWGSRVRNSLEINGITINFEIEEDSQFDGIIFSENLNEMRRSYNF
jgi:hypothetical protein